MLGASNSNSTLLIVDNIGGQIGTEHSHIMYIPVCLFFPLCTSPLLSVSCTSSKPLSLYMAAGGIKLTLVGGSRLRNQFMPFNASFFFFFLCSGDAAGNNELNRWRVLYKLWKWLQTLISTKPHSSLMSSYSSSSPYSGAYCIIKEEDECWILYTKWKTLLSCLKLAIH